jgi:hypothetical protein
LRLKTPTPVLPTITETFDDTLLVLVPTPHTFNVQQAGRLEGQHRQRDPERRAEPYRGDIKHQWLHRDRPCGGGRGFEGSDLEARRRFVARSAPVSDIGNLVEPVTYTVTVLHS